MNKYISLAMLAAVMSCSMASAQSTTEENPYLPQKGDFAFGVDLVPIIKTIGGAFDNNYGDEKIGGTPFVYDTEAMYLKPNVSIMGKYMLTDKWAAKVNVGLHLRNYTNREYVGDDLGLYLDPNSEAKVIDTRKMTESGCTFMLGTEYRLGKRRVQGVFGFGLLVGFSTSNLNFSYGNKMTDFNQSPTTYNWNGGPVPPGETGETSRKDFRVLSQSNANCALGAYGSVGVEWFVGKKIALGASVDIYAYGAFSTKDVTKGELFNDAYQAVEKHKNLNKPVNSGASFGTDNLGGSLYAIFYF